MSYDLMIFDADGLSDFPSDASAINSWFNAFVAQNPDKTQGGTAKVENVIAEMGQKYGTTVGNGSIWTLWPPICLANGRCCTFNLDWSSDTTNAAMLMAEVASKHGLVLIDPQGRSPILTAPNGGGLLDI